MEGHNCSGFEPTHFACDQPKIRPRHRPSRELMTHCYHLTVASVIEILPLCELL